jgi:nickel-dependent lactate racemase
MRKIGASFPGIAKRCGIDYKQEIADILSGSKTRDWKKIQVDFGDDFLDIEVPSDCEILSMPSMPCLIDSVAEITQALNQPTGSPTLSEIIHSKGKPVEDLTVCITVSDITRPAPYKGENGLLLPLLALIEQTGVKREKYCFSHRQWHAPPQYA